MGLSQKRNILALGSDYMRRAGSVEGASSANEPAHFNGLFHIKCQLLSHGSKLAR